MKTTGNFKNDLLKNNILKIKNNMLLLNQKIKKYLISCFYKINFINYLLKYNFQIFIKIRTSNKLKLPIILIKFIFLII